MRRRSELAVTVLCVAGLSGVLTLAPPIPAQPARAVSAKVTTAAPAVAASRTCVSTGAGVSPLTGLSPRGGVPIATKVDNMTLAWPHSGLESADMNFVEEIEKGYTRHVAVFSSAYPKRVGSIRSARETDLELQAAFGRPAMVYSGAAKVVKALIKKKAVPAFSEASFSKGFKRDRVRAKTHGNTHSLYVDLQKVAAAARSRGALPLSKQSWCFGGPQPGGRAVSQVKVTWPRMGVAGTWNAKARKWVMSYRLPNGRPHAAQNERGQSITASNVVVLLTTRTQARIAYKGGPLETAVPWTHTTGSGGAIVLRDGKGYSAAWSRTATGAFRLTSTNGKTVRLHQGHTWFLMASQDRTLTVTPQGKKPISSGISLSRAIPAAIARAVPKIGIVTAAKAPVVKVKAKVKAKPAVHRTLKIGSQGSDVKVVQRKLKVSPVSGYFFTKTHAAVKAFQHRKHLSATGVVNAATWRLINRLR